MALRTYSLVLNLTSLDDPSIPRASAIALPEVTIPKATSDASSYILK